MRSHAPSSRCWSIRWSASSAPNICSTASRSRAPASRIISAASCMGLPMGVDVCYTNHAEADQDDADALLTLLTAAGVTFVMGVPGADDVMLNYQSTSFHDALAMRDLLGRRPAPEFDAWLAQQGLLDAQARIRQRTMPAALPRAAAAMTDKPLTPADDGPWERLRRLTPARIGLARAGASLADRAAARLSTGACARPRCRARAARRRAPRRRSRVVVAAGAAHRQRRARTPAIPDAPRPRPPARRRRRGGARAASRRLRSRHRGRRRAVRARGADACGAGAVARGRRRCGTTAGASRRSSSCARAASPSATPLPRRWAPTVSRC